MMLRHLTSNAAVTRIGSAIVFAALCQAATARPSCTFSSGSSVDFGIYDVYASQANNFGVGSIHIQCQGGGGPFKVTLSPGQSNSFAERQMRNGNMVLRYNLYTSASRSVVWGDETATSNAVHVPKNTHSKLDIFGQIPALQDVPVGTYIDHVTAIVNF